MMYSFKEDLLELPTLLIPKERNIRLIGICGKAGAGKDTVAKHLGNKFCVDISNEGYTPDVYIFSFAEALKQVCASLCGVDISAFRDQEYKEINNDFWNKSPREFLQFVGTDLIRNHIHPNFWVARMHGTLMGQLAHPNSPTDDPDFFDYQNCDIIFSDVRFQNELDYIYQNGGKTIRIVRPDTSESSVGIPNHQSEATEKLKFDLNKHRSILNDGSLEDLNETVNKLYDKWFK